MNPEELAAELEKAQKLNDAMAVKQAELQARLEAFEEQNKKREEEELSEVERLRKELETSKAEAEKVKALEEAVNSYQRDYVQQLEEDLKGVPESVKKVFSETCALLELDYKANPQRAVSLLSQLKKLPSSKTEGVPPLQKYSKDSSKEEDAKGPDSKSSGANPFHNISLSDALGSLRNGKGKG